MNGRTPAESPWGRALLGKAEGEEVAVEAPSGSIRDKMLTIAR